MRRRLRWRGVVISLVFAVCLFVGIYPIVASHYGVNSPSWLMAKELKLGLDLQGGVHLVLRVRTDEVLRGETESAVARLLEALKERQIAFGHVSRIDSTHFAVDGIPAASAAAADGVLRTRSRTCWGPSIEVRARMAPIRSR